MELKPISQQELEDRLGSQRWPADVPDADGNNLLHRAAGLGDLRSLELLLEPKGQGNPWLVNARGETPMALAAAGGHADAIRLLLEAGVPSYGADKAGRSPLHRAAEAGAAHAVSVLLEAGAAVDPADKRGRTPLLLAVSAGHEKVARRLHRAGADPCREGGWLGMTPLHEAVRLNLSSLAGSFIVQGERASPRDAWGRTPLHLAAQRGNREACVTLIALGADVDTQDRNGNTPLHSACRGELHGNTDAKERGDIVHLLVDGGAADPNIANQDGQTALHWAAAEMFTESLKNLLDADGDPNLLDQNRHTPFRWVVMSGYPDLVSMVLSAGADPDMRDIRGETSLHWAARQGFGDVVGVLLKARADPHVLNRDGQSPFDLASECRGADGTLDHYNLLKEAQAPAGGDLPEPA